MEDLSTKLKANIWKFYLVSILGGFTYFYNGIETLYYRHFNLSFEQIGFLISSMLLATLLLEVPTGAFADLYGRKKSVLIASIFGLIGISLLAFGSTFEIFSVAFVSLGISRAFSSGAGSALLYDSLHSLQKADDFIKHKSRLDSSFIAIDLISGTLGFFLFAMNVRLPYYISLTAWILVFIVQFSMYESFIPKERTTSLITHNLGQMKKGFLLTIRSFPIIWLTAFSFLFFISCRFFSDVISTPFLQETKQFSLIQLSILFLITNSIQASFVFYAHYFEKLFGRNRSIILSLVIVPLTYFSMIISNNFIITGIIVGIYYAVISFSEIIVESTLNKIVESDSRATVLSVSSMFISGFGLLVLPILGAKTDQTDLTTGMILTAILTLIFGVFLLATKIIFRQRTSI
jgi:MFS family permease